MAVYIALLRGINVGGHHKIKMADLKKLLEAAGLCKVQTYIQSGNIVFESEESEAELRKKMEELIVREFGFPSAVIIRSADELDSIMEKCPYSPDALTDKMSIHLLLYPELITPAQIAALPELDTGEDRFVIDGREIYQYYSQSMLDSKLPKLFQKLPDGTDRNWKTVVKLREMVDGLRS